MTALEQTEVSIAAPMQSLIEQGILTPTAFHVAAVVEITGRSDEDNLAGVPEFMQWVAIGHWLGGISTAVKWWIGDWLSFGEGAWGERYAQAAEATGLDIGTLQNWAYTCRQVLPSRRRAELSFTAHYAVAKLEPAEQEEWLGYAVKRNQDAPPGVRFGSKDLRVAIKESGGKVPGGRVAKDAGEISTTNGKQQLYVDPDAVVKAARMVWKHAQRDGDAYRVPLDAFAGLATALGKD